MLSLNSLRTAIFPLFLLSLGIQASRAQARLDDSLPEAPLPHRRVLFLFPGFETVEDPAVPVAPLRAHQKFQIAFRKTVDPSFLVYNAFFSGFDAATGYGPDYGHGWGPFGQLYGYNAANTASTYFFSDGLLPTLFHQDPRYFRKRSGSVGSRIWWALRSEAVTYGDHGQQMPNYSELIGFGMSTALANAYSPSSSVTVGGNFERYGVKFGVGFGLNLVREFGAVSQLEKHQPGFTKHLPHVHRGGKYAAPDGTE